MERRVSNGNMEQNNVFRGERFISCSVYNIRPFRPPFFVYDGHLRRGVLHLLMCC